MIAACHDEHGSYLLHDPEYSAANSNYYCRRCKQGMGNDYYVLAQKFTTLESDTIELCAKVLDALHAKVGEAWDFYSEERVDGAHNTLTNGAKAIRALKGKIPLTIPDFLRKGND